MDSRCEGTSEDWGGQLFPPSMMLTQVGAAPCSVCSRRELPLALIEKNKSLHSTWNSLLNISEFLSELSKPNAGVESFPALLSKRVCLKMVS